MKQNSSIQTNLYFYVRLDFLHLISLFEIKGSMASKKKIVNYIMPFNLIKFNYEIIKNAVSILNINVFEQRIRAKMHKKITH